MRLCALTVYFSCILLSTENCLPAHGNQDEPAVSSTSSYPEEFCSVVTGQFGARVSEQDTPNNCRERGSVYEVESVPRENHAFQAGIESLQSPDIQRSNGSENEDPSRIIQNKVQACGVAVFQGRRPSQEDRAICLSHIYLPVSATENISVGLYAIFDGHGGQEASTFTAESFYQHFLDHFSQILDSNELALTVGRKTLLQDDTQLNQGTWFQDAQREMEVSAAGVLLETGHGVEWLDSEASSQAAKFLGDDGVHISEVGIVKDNRDEGCKTVEKDFDGARDQAGVLPEERWRHFTRKVLEDGVTIRQILEEGLYRTIYSIDSSFSLDARKLGLYAGTTACIVLQVEDDLLIANLGDSKAFFCEPSDEVTCGPKPGLKRQRVPGVHKRACKVGFRTRELTRDHSPDRVDEEERVVTAGGFVAKSGGVARVNGKLAVSRAIGDVHLKEFGIIADPEFTGWVKIPNNQTFLAIASDGVFEKLSSQNVCDILYAISVKEDAFALLGLDNSRNGAPIAMLPVGKAYTHPSDYYIRPNPDTEERSEVSEEGILEEKSKKYYGAISPSHESKEEDPAGASPTIKSTPEEETGLVQSMAQAVGEAALELGTMDNVAIIVLSLQPLPLIPLAVKTTDEASYLTEDVQTDINPLSDGFPQRLADETGLKPVPQPGSVSPKDSTSRTWSKSHIQNKSSALMMHNLDTPYCYELIEALPRHAIVPPTNVVDGGILYTDENEYREGFPMTGAQRGREYDRRNEVGGSLEVYREHLVCTPKQTHEKELCLRPEGLSRFLALLGSVPLDSQTLLPEMDFLGGLADRPGFVPSSIHYHRYMLKKNFARGAFGEVWLAVRRARSAPEERERDEFSSSNTTFYSSCSTDEGRSHTTEPANSNKRERTTYVLKRILVERGNHVYLSGLREKYFGEVFLNASIARARAAKHSYSFSCPAWNPFSSSRSGFCPWRFNSSRSFMKRNSGAGGTDKFMGHDGSDFRISTFEEGDKHIVRYVESFESIEPRELWLVFKNEGKSLSSILYSSEGAEVEPGMEGVDGLFTVVQPSPWWHWLKSTSSGRREMRSILRQLLLAVKSCHSRNITHRDIKPENMIVNWRTPQSVAGPSKSEYPSKLKMRLIDFGSALDPVTVKHMYGPSGPSRLEQTNEYASPEALFGNHWLHFHSHHAHVYDLWSVGVVMLELVLGTPHVFQISTRTRALLDRRLQGWDQSARETAYMLRAFLEMCILLPGISLQHQFHHHRNNHDHTEEQRLASWECTEQAFMQQVKQRDPLGIGMPDKWALRLVRRLLQWYPEDRISAEDALKHPYFHPKLQVD